VAQDIKGIVDGDEIDVTAALSVLQEWAQVAGQLDELKAREADLRARVKKFMESTGKSVGKIGDANVLTYKPKNTFAEARFRKERSDLAPHFTATVVKEVIDVAALREAYPDVYAQFQVRDLRPDYDAILAAKLV